MWKTIRWALGSWSKTARFCVIVAVAVAPGVIYLELVKR
jgi:hypothetical protein